MRRQSLGLFAALAVMGAIAFAQSPLSSQPSPKAVMERFCKMEAEGKHLTAEGWREMAAFLAFPVAESRREETIVIKHFDVSDPVIEGSQAKVSVEYTVLGVLDARNLSFGPRGPQPIEPEKMTFERVLVLSGKHADIGPDGVVREVEGPPEWRIQGQAEPHISVQTAIHYLQQLRMKTNNNTFKKSADESIATLRKLQ